MSAAKTRSRITPGRGRGAETERRSSLAKIAVTTVFYPRASDSGVEPRSCYARRGSLASVDALLCRGSSWGMAAIFIPSLTLAGARLKRCCDRKGRVCSGAGLRVHSADAKNGPAGQGGRGWDASQFSTFLLSGRNVTLGRLCEQQHGQTQERKRLGACCQRVTVVVGDHGSPQSASIPDPGGRCCATHSTTRTRVAASQ